MSKENAKYKKDLPKTERLNRGHNGEGHRRRLREKFLRSGLDSLNDYEIVELLLTLGTPRKDCKQVAKEAIKQFRGLRGVLDASLEELQKIKGIGPMNAFGTKLFQAMAERYAREKIFDKIKFNSPEVVAEYLQQYIGREKKEYFVMLYLDARDNLIVDKVSIGTLDTSLVHPREVFKNAIQVSAAQVIIAHNHPSDDPGPSEDDLVITRRLVEAGKILGVKVIDHIIITKSDYFSLKDKGLI